MFGFVDHFCTKFLFPRKLRVYHRSEGETKCDSTLLLEKRKITKIHLNCQKVNEIKKINKIKLPYLESCF